MRVEDSWDEFYLTWFLPISASPDSPLPSPTEEELEDHEQDKLDFVENASLESNALELDWTPVKKIVGIQDGKVFYADGTSGRET